MFSMHWMLKIIKHFNVSERYSHRASHEMRMDNARTEATLPQLIQLTLVISTSLISNNRLSRSENLVPALT